MTDAGEFCRIPVTATLVVHDGVAEMISADWRDVSADWLARWLLSRGGLDAQQQGVC